MKAAKFFVGLGIFSTNKYDGDNQKDEAKQEHEWYINTVSCSASICVLGAKLILELIQANLEMCLYILYRASSGAKFATSSST